MGEAKRRKATGGVQTGASSNIPYVLPIDAMAPENFYDPRFSGVPMIEMWEAMEALLSGSAGASDHLCIASVDTPTGPLKVLLIYPHPIAMGAQEGKAQ
jgi:hypothetical protein